MITEESASASVAQPPQKRPRTDAPQAKPHQQQQQQLCDNQGRQKRKSGLLCALFDASDDELEAGHGAPGQQIQPGTVGDAGPVGPQVGAGTSVQQQQTQQNPQCQQTQQQQTQHQHAQQHKQPRQFCAHEQTLPRAAAPPQHHPTRVSAYFSQDPSWPTPCQAPAHSDPSADGESQQQHLPLAPNTQEQALLQHPGPIAMFTYPHIASHQAVAQPPEGQGAHTATSEQHGRHHPALTQPPPPQPVNGPLPPATVCAQTHQSSPSTAAAPQPPPPQPPATSQQQSSPLLAAAAPPLSAAAPSKAAAPPPPSSAAGPPSSQARPNKASHPQLPAAPQAILASLAGPSSARASKLTQPTKPPQASSCRPHPQHLQPQQANTTCRSPSEAQATSEPHAEPPAAAPSSAAVLPAPRAGAAPQPPLSAPPSAPLAASAAAPPPSPSAHTAAAVAPAPPLGQPAPTAAAASAAAVFPAAHAPAAPPQHSTPLTHSHTAPNTTHTPKPAPSSSSAASEAAAAAAPTSSASLHAHTAAPPPHHTPPHRAGAAAAADRPLHPVEDHAPPPAQVPMPAPGLTVVHTLPQLCALLLHVRAARRFGFALHFRAADGRGSGRHSGSGAASHHHIQQQHQEQQYEAVQGVAVSVEDRGCYYVCVPNDDASEGGQMLLGLQELLTDAHVTKASYKLKQQHQLLSGQSGLRVRAPLVDVWLCLYLRDPGTLSSLPASMGSQVLEQQLARYAGSAALSELAQGLPSSRSAQRQPLSGPSAAASSPSSSPALGPGYLDALNMAALSRKLYDVLYPGLKRDGMLKALIEIEMPLVPILARMEARGMCCDLTTLVRQQIPLQQRIAQLERLAWKAAGMEFHLNSPKQVSEALFDRIKLKPPLGCVRNKSGYLSTKSEVLEEMQGQHPVIDVMLEHRRLVKQHGLINNLLDTLATRSAHMQRIISLANAHGANKGGKGPSTSVSMPLGSNSTNLPVPGHPSLARLQGTFNQAGTATGRLAMDNPNLQTVPKPCEYELTAPGRPDQQQKMEVNMRSAFIATPGHVLLAVDYCQVELRLMAHFCGDPQLCHSMREEEPDPFKPITAMWLRCSRDEVTPEQRNQAKRLTYAVLYGLGPFALAQELKVDVKTAWTMIQSFQQSMPSLMSWMERIVADCHKDGFVTMLSGRRRYLPHIRSTDQSARAQAERQAINSVVQGSAADLIKRGMVLLDSLLRAKMDGAARLVLQVHDELLFEVKVGHVQQVAALVRKAMSGAWRLRVPFPVKLSIGPSWGELQETSLLDVLGVSNI